MKKMISNYFLLSITSLIISFLLTPAVKKLARLINAVDLPGKRRINEIPIPNIGGLAIYASFVITALIFLEVNKTLIGILVGGSLITFIGFISLIFGLLFKFSMILSFKFDP